MRLRSSISLTLLFALLLWSMSAICAPMPVVHRAHCTRLLYKTMVVEHPAAHPGSTPEKMIVVVCYRMHSSESDTMTKCASLPADDAVIATAKYHDDGQARSCAVAHATFLLVPTPHIANAPWEGAGHFSSRSVLDTKSDLRI